MDPRARALLRPTAMAPISPTPAQPATPRRRASPRISSLVLLALVAALLIGGVALMWGTISREQAERARAEQTDRVLTAIRDIEDTAMRAEAGQRGYFITTDRRYLAPYVEARARIVPAVRHLRATVGEGATAQQTELLDRVAQLSAAKFAELDESVQLVTSRDIIAARERILTDEGQDLSERLFAALRQLREVERASHAGARADAASSESRIIPTLVVLLMVILAALSLGLVQIVRTADAEARAANASALGAARDRADLLARELNHRVKNLFAVVLAIVKMSGKDAPEAKPVIERIAARIMALLKAHEVTQGVSAQRSAALDALVETALDPYRSAEHRAVIEGPLVDLPETKVVPLGLVLHELVTNAVKYGAWSQPGGTIAVRWTRDDGRLHLEWEEACAFPCISGEDARRGFGSTLIDGSARQLEGTITREWRDSGLAVTIDCPLG